MIKALKKIIYPLDKKDYNKILFLFILILINAILELISISLLIPILTIFVSDDYLSFSKYLFFFDFENKIQVLSFSLILFLIIYFIKLLITTGVLYFQTRFSYSLYTKISQSTFKKYLNENYLFHLSANSSNLLRNVTSESNLYSFGLVLPVIKLISDLIIFIAISCLLLIYSLTTSIIAIIFLSISSYIIYKITSFNMEHAGSMRQTHSAKMIKEVNQGLGNIKEIILYKLQSFFLKKFMFHNEAYAKSGRIKDIIIDLPRIILEFIIILIFISSIFFLIYEGNKVSEIVIILGVFAFASFRLLPTIVKIIKSFNTIKYNLPVFKLIYSELEDSDKKNISAENDIDQSFQFKNLNIKNLNYSYKSKDEKKIILSNINFNINSGDKIGIKGETGSGKTTLINLIIGLLNDHQGEIKLNGNNLNYNLLSYQNKIGYVPQSVYLADETILFNITLDDEKNLDEKKLSKILSLVKLNDFVEKLPNRLNTVIGERGAKLSGGQCQRIGIARALYRDPSIIVFDEATSSLDEQTENKILDNLFNNNLDKTIIIISHRNNSFKYCKKIFEVKNKNLKDL